MEPNWADMESAPTGHIKKGLNPDKITPRLLMPRLLVVDFSKSGSVEFADY